MNGEGWICKIKKMAPGVFKTEMTWATDEQPAAEEKPAPKKRGRKKKPVAAAA